MRKYVFKKRWKRAVMTALDAVGSALFFFYGMFRKKGRQKRVLVLRLDQIGDMIQAMPFFGSLRKKYPGYEVHVLCVRDCYFLLDNNPDIDAVHALSSSWFYKERAFDRKEFAGKIRQLRALEFEAAYDLRGDIRNIWTLVRAGAGKIYGYGSGGGST
ncbi:MAG: hypothetical protein LLG37_05445, partial [Spirochaetia bacterium]|nr:hypothetical protein [Spirochaetia bacterium]